MINIGVFKTNFNSQGMGKAKENTGNRQPQAACFPADPVNLFSDGVWAI
jgi:hypothetical protein